MPFDFQQRKSFCLRIIFVLEYAAIGDAVLHDFVRILPSAKKVDAGAGMGDGEHGLVVAICSMISVQVRISRSFT